MYCNTVLDSLLRNSPIMGFPRDVIMLASASFRFFRGRPLVGAPPPPPPPVEPVVDGAAGPKTSLPEDMLTCGNCMFGGGCPTPTPPSSW